MVNKHYMYTKGRDSNELLQNYIFSKIYKITTDLSNIIPSNRPVSSEEAEQLAVRSKLGKKADTMTEVNPMDMISKFEENMDGKGVVGISANGQKAFFALTYYFNQKIKEGNIDHVIFSKKYAFLNDAEEIRYLLANTSANKEQTLETLYEVINNIYTDPAQ